MEQATTQFNDVRGTAAADWNPGGIHALATAAGIDVDRYFPVGLSVYTEVDDLTLKVSEIIVVDMKGWPLKTFDNVRDYLHNNPGKVQTLHVEADIALAPYTKRFQVVLGSRDLVDVI